jgi:hypothetical protein
MESWIPTSELELKAKVRVHGVYAQFVNMQYPDTPQYRAFTRAVMKAFSTFDGYEFTSHASGGRDSRVDGVAVSVCVDSTRQRVAKSVSAADYKRQWTVNKGEFFRDNSVKQQRGGEGAADISGSLFADSGGSGSEGFQNSKWMRGGAKSGTFVEADLTITFSSKQVTWQLLDLFGHLSVTKNHNDFARTLGVADPASPSPSPRTQLVHMAQAHR